MASRESWLLLVLTFLLNVYVISSASSGYRFVQHKANKSNDDGPLVQTEYGSVRGVYLYEGREVRAFLGIPYADPPVGKLRWQPPRKQQSWNEEYQATEQPVGCPQNCGEPDEACPPGFSENCLYLDVYTPRNANSKSNLPVMLFLHGGNFQSGGAGGKLYDGRYIANMSEAVVVVINYRLGALGFMVTSGSEDRLTGNYGFLDQQAALRFVRDNIKNFGGNPNLVTLFGQSAGAQSIAIHLIAKESEPLFHQAILESMPFTIPYQSPTSGAELGALTAELLGCLPTDVVCLRSRSAEEVLQKSNEAANMILDPESPLQVFEPWGPMIDGEIVPADPLRAFQAGKFWRKPMILGTTSEEGVLYIYGIWGEPPRFIEAYAFLLLVLKDREETREVIERYDVNMQEDLRDPLSEGCTDYIFGCSTRNASRVAHLGGASVFHYIFDHAFSFEDAWGPGENPCKGRVCHGGDLPFVFHTAPLGGYHYTPTELRLTNSMVTYFGNFAHTGDPNNNNWSNKPRREYEHWPKYSESTNWASIILKTPKNIVQTRYRDDFCNMWDEIGYEEN